jgi:hypothetical protein
MKVREEDGRSLACQDRVISCDLKNLHSYCVKYKKENAQSEIPPFCLEAGL